MHARDMILSWLDNRLDSASAAWLHAQCAALADGAPERSFHLAFGQALRRAGKGSLAARALEQADAFGLHPGWDLAAWTREQAARAALLLSLADSPESDRSVLALFQTADLGEHVALVRALFLMPSAPRLLHIAREGIRSNMGDVFEATAHRNPYPAEHFDDIAWNQMIVKCIFVGLPLSPVHGLDRRVNPELSRMLASLARERWAAGRALPSEAWRCVGPCADDEAIAVLEAALDRGHSDRRGAALGLWSAPGGKGRQILDAKAPELVPSLQAGTLTWENHDKN